MPKPVKIKKPKSFMFTTKHHSFSGIMGCIVCIISILVMIIGIYSAFINKGKSSLMIGSQGMLSLVLNFIGIISGVTALSERDIHKWVPITAIVANGIMLSVWILLVLNGA